MKTPPLSKEPANRSLTGAILIEPATDLGATSQGLNDPAMTPAASRREILKNMIAGQQIAAPGPGRRRKVG